MLTRPNLLFSYHYMRQDPRFEAAILALAPYCNVLIDSGAFSDWNQGRQAAEKGKTHTPIDLGEYISACKRYHGRVWQYIMLDVINNPPASRVNLDRMVDAGLRPMPVFVYPDNLDNVTYLTEVNEYICVPGGAVGSARRFMWQRFQRTFEASGRKAKLHGLGFVKQPDMFHLPLHTVDASTWSVGAQYGSIKRFQGPNGFKCYAASTDVRKKNELRGFLVNNGVSTTELNDPNCLRKHYGIPTMFTVFAYLQLQNYCATRGKPHLFLAVVGMSWLINLIAGLAAATPGHFDYPVARDMHRHLFSLAKEPDRQIDVMVNVMRTRTKWEVTDCIP